MTSMFPGVSSAFAPTLQRAFGGGSPPNMGMSPPPQPVFEQMAPSGPPGAGMVPPTLQTPPPGGIPGAAPGFGGQLMQMLRDPSFQQNIMGMLGGGQPSPMQVPQMQPPQMPGLAAMRGMVPRGGLFY